MKAKVTLQIDLEKLTQVFLTLKTLDQISITSTTQSPDNWGAACFLRDIASQLTR